MAKTFNYQDVKSNQKVYKYEEVRSDIPTTLNCFEDFSDVTDELVKRMMRLKIDLFKACIESTGQDCGITNTPVETHNYIKGEEDESEYTNKTILESIKENWQRWIKTNACAGSGIGYMSPHGLQYLLHVEGWTGGDYKQPVVAKQQGIDRAGVITVGPGLTNLAFPQIKAGETYTFEQLCGMFAEFIQKLCAQIDTKCPQVLGFGQGAIDMVLSLGYNAGPAWINKMANTKSKEDVAALIGGGPTTANGKTLSGLVSRRASEASIALGIDNGSADCKIYFGELDQKTQDVLAACGGGGEGGDPSLQFGGGTLKVTGDTKHLELQVKRGAIKDYGGRKGCFGQLFVNGQYFCDCAERATNTTGKLHPTGKKFKVVTKPGQGNSRTGRSDWLSKGASGNAMYQFAKISNGYIPQIMGTGASGIRIHEGTGPAWSEGCLIVGTNKGGRFSADSTLNAWKSIYSALMIAESANITYS